MSRLGVIAAGVMAVVFLQPAPVMAGWSSQIETIETGTVGSLTSSLFCWARAISSKANKDTIAATTISNLINRFTVKYLLIVFSWASPALQPANTTSGKPGTYN